MTDIDKREIRGITGKFARWFLIYYTTMIISIAGAFFGIKAMIVNESNERANKDTLINVQLQTNNAKLNQIEIFNRQLDSRQNMLEIQNTRIMERLHMNK